jgi:hypothetical protein
MATDMPTGFMSKAMDKRMEKTTNGRGSRITG